MPTHTHYSDEISAQLNQYTSYGEKEAAKHRLPTEATRIDQHETALQSEAEKWLASEQRLFDAPLSDTTRSIVQTQQRSFELQTHVDQLASDSFLLRTIETEKARCA